jgi:hypothetical protein
VQVLKTSAFNSKSEVNKMKIRHLVVVIVTVLSLTGSASSATVSTDELTERAVSAKPEESASAINDLRVLGQPGLDALFAKYPTEITRFARTGDATGDWKLIANAIDTVAMQKDAYASQLYWYTDLEEAKRAARAQNKPILSLRLLGNLNDEFSCANSRLFRAILYANADVSKFLRENYILHWRSVRPAPKVTIDFGDGRKIERTLTGNSIHYILDKNGEIIDALAGLYSPSVFLQYLQGGLTAARELDAVPVSKRQIAIMKYRKSNFDRIVTSRNNAVAAARVTLAEPKDTTEALAVQSRAVSKALVVNEVSILRVFDDFAKFEPQINSDDWNKLARIYSPSAKLDKKSIEFVRRQNAKTGLTETEFTGLFAKLENFLALDTTRNDFLFHTRLFEMLNQGRAGDLETFNARVYADIFKTPNSDKWLGLYSPDIYTALDGNGFVEGLR